MAVITKMPGAAVISGFKGTLDFYVHQGTNCVRKWPRSPGHSRAPGVEAGWPAFAWAASNWNSLSPEVQDAYKTMASGTKLTGRDLFVKSFISATIVRLD
ncbi:unnamed protein product [marine sediment metagenome]|uniref:Uncharacterized protein n=1 Tax=marine sediment metagenome TaxID=412755 RepID=X1SIC5_9ZZZZ